MNLYDPNKDYRDVPPYAHHTYKSVYEGIQIEIQIIDHCNLNCRNCNHFSPCLKPWTMSIEEFNLTLIKIKNNIPNVKDIALIGGEPTLHPNIVDFWTMAREIFPEARIEIITNGINLKLLNNNLQSLLSNKIYIHFTFYPEYTNATELKEFCSNYKNSLIVNSRIAMGETLISIQEENKNNNFFKCKKFPLPCFTVRDYKLYFCPFTALTPKFLSQYNMESLFPEEIERRDYLDLDYIKNDLNIIQDFCYTPKSLCAYCHHETNLIPWIKSDRQKNEYFISIKDLYFSDYEKYLTIIDNHTALDACLQYNLKVQYDIYEGNESVINRFKKTYIDIIIIYNQMSKDMLNKLEQMLNNQTFISNCALYFVSNQSKQDKAVINTFFNSKLYTTFLKNNNNFIKEDLINHSLEYSYSPYIILLDFENNQLFKDNNDLEILYNTIHNSTQDNCTINNISIIRRNSIVGEINE